MSSFSEDLGTSASVLVNAPCTLNAIQVSGRCPQNGPMWLWLYDHASPTAATTPIMCIPFDNHGVWRDLPATSVSTKLTARVTAGYDADSPVVPCGNCVTVWHS